MESSAYKWLVSQYRFVLNRMRTHEFMEEHPTCAPAATPPRKAKRELAGFNLKFDRLEDRVMLSSSPVDEALRDLTHVQPTKQLFYLATKGASDVDYRGPVTVNDIDVPLFTAPGALKGREADVLDSMLGALNGAFGSDAQFTLDRPAGGEFSTIYIGGDNEAFAQWGDYSGVAEGVDAGNQDQGDIAFVFSDNIDASGISAADFGEQIAGIVAHEAGHLIGMAHAGDHGQVGPEGPLDDVAFDPKVHVSIGKDVRADVLDGNNVTINGANYAVHPKIVAALTNWESYFNAGCVAGDGFPDALMGQFLVHAEENATWLTRLLDMAWQAQSDLKYTPDEQSQILAFTYGYLAHSTGDLWAHSLVNEFAEGTAPGFIAGAVSLPKDQRDLANMLRHLMTEAYIANALEGVDKNKNRTEMTPGGDVTDDTTPGIQYDAPIRFIYDAFIRAFPDDPAPILELDWDGGALNAVPVFNTFVRTAGSIGGGISGLLGDDIKVGHVITVTGFTNPANNGKFRVTAVFPDNILGNVLATTITVQGLAPGWPGLVAETASGDEKIRVYVPKTPKIILNANAAAGTFTRTDGLSFKTEGFVAGMRMSAYGFNANFDNLIVKTVDDNVLTVVGKLNPGDAAGSGDEQLVVQGSRGPLVNTFFRIRDKVYSKAVERGDRPAGGFGGLMSQLLDKIATGAALDAGFKDNLLTAYLYQWADSIDDGVKHWAEFGYALTKAMFDPQSRRDSQNKRGAAFGPDTLANTARGNAENAVNFLHVLLDELEDPNGDGKTNDSFFNNHLLAMFGLPKQLGVLRTAIQGFNSFLEGVIDNEEDQPFTPTEVTKPEAEASKEGFLRKLFRKRFNIDFDTFNIIHNLHAKMDVKSITIGSNTFSLFKFNDHERLDALLGLGADHHVPGGPDVIANVVYHENAEGQLADDAHFNKLTFAAYKNAVTMTKMALLMETSPDSDASANNQISALYTALRGSAYNAKLLNMHGAHGGNVLTMTLPDAAGTDTPWLVSIDADHVWRSNSFTTTTARFRVSNQKTADSPATWRFTVPAGQYKVYATWQANVTQDMNNLTNPNHPDQKISPATNAKYTIFNDTTELGQFTKNQQLFPDDFEHNALVYEQLGAVDFDITTGIIQVKLSSIADGHVIAGPIVLVPVGGGTPIVIQNGRDRDTLSALLPADDYVDNGTDWDDMVYPTGTGNNPLWESILLRPGFRTLFTDWQNGLPPFPDLGDGTSPDPNTALGLVKNERESHATPFGPQFQAFTSQTIEIPIPNSLKNAILDGLNGLVNLTKAIENTAPFNVTLPGLDKSIAQILGMSDKVHENVRKPIADYFAGDPTPTVGELYNVIETKIGGAMDNVSPTIEFDVDLRKIFSVSDIKLALGQKAADFGLTLDGTLSANASVAFVDALNAALPKLTFGVNLDPNSSVALLDRVYVKADRALLHADIHATNLDLAARFGFLGIGIVDGTFDLEADVEITFVDPNSDGKITLNEITNTTLADLIDVQADGNLTAALPVQVQAGLTGMASATVGTVDITAPELFDLSTYDVQFNGSFTDVLNFNNIDAASLAGLLGKLTFWLDQFRKSDEFKNLDLPLVGPALDKVLQFADAFRDKILIDDNDDDLDGPTTLLHDINAALAQAGLGDKVRAQNEGGKIKLILNDASITAFTITGATGLGFGATQTSPAGGVFKSILATNTAPTDGKPAANVTFNISLDGGPATEVRLYKTAGPAPFDAATAVNTGTDRITMTAHGLNTGDLVKYSTGGGTAVGGVTNGGTYYIIRLDANTIQLASSLANAQAVTPVAIDLTAVGAGLLHTLAHPDNTDDNTTIGNDKWKLVNADNGATFATAQQMVLKLAEIFGSSTLQYHPSDETLTFSLNLNETFGSIPLPLNFNFEDLEPLLGLQSSGSIVLSADGTMNLTVGVFLGAAPSSTKLDGNELITALNDGVHIKTEQLVTAANDVKQEFGRLTGDAAFKLFVNGAAVGTDVIVTKTSTDTNTTVADLVADVNTALTTAGLNAQVQAIADGLKVVIKGIGATTALKLTAVATNPGAQVATSPTVRELGFAADVTAQVVDGVLKIVGRDQLPFATGRLGANAVFQVSLSTVNGGSPVTVTVDQAETQNNRNLLDVISDVQKAIDAIPSLKDKIKVASSGRKLTFTAVEPTATSFSITAVAGNPAITVFGLAASNIGNSDEFIITLRNGTRHGVKLDALKLDATSDLNDIMAAIIAQVGAANIDVQIDDKQLGLKLRDKTSGPNMFKVESANGTTAAIDLGILKQDAPTPVEGVESEAPDGFIDGAAIGGIKLTDRFFIQTANVNIGLHMTTPEDPADSDGDADTNDGIKATAKFGFVGVELAGGGSVNANFTMGLKDPKTVADDGRITLTELIDALDDINTVVNAPALTGGGSIALAVNVNPSLPGLDLGSDPKIVFNIVDLGNPFTGDLPTVNLTFPDLGDLVDFDNLNFNFQTIIDGLKALSSFLSEFESFGFLSQPLPLVNVSVNDLIGLAEKFGQAIEEAESNPAGTIQLLENKIKEAFGIPLTGPGTDLFNLVLVNDNNGTAGNTADDFQILKMELDLSAAFDEGLNVDFDLGGGLSLGGAADLNAAGSIDLSLDVGLRLDDPTQIYVFNTTGLTGALNVGGTNLSFNAAAGPLGVFINGGHATIGGTVDLPSTPGTDNKLFAADLRNATYVNGRALISDINFGSAFFAQVGAGVDVALPVYFPTASTRTGTVLFTGSIGYNTSTKGFSFTGAPSAVDENNAPIPFSELFAFDPSQISILDGLLLGVDGVDLFLEGLQDLLDGDLFSFELPLIGDKLSDAADVIGDFRDGFVVDFRAALEALANPAAAFNAATGNGQPDPVSKILFQLLGPTGLGLLKDGPDAGTNVNQSDIIFTSNIATPGTAPEDLFFDWDFKLGDTIEAGAGIGFDVGIPGLGLETTGAIDFDLDWALSLGFGINLDDGFYFDIANKDALGVKHPELEIKADVTVPGGSIKGTLGFLQLSATDNPNGDATATHLGATFGVDIINRNNLNDEKLSFSEIGRIGVTAGIAAEAVVDLGAKLALSSDLIPGAATNFPSIVADFRLEWGLGDRANGTLVNLSDLDGGFLENGLKFVGFEHVGLDLGSYFSDLIGPIAEKVQDITSPIKPFLDFLTTPIPVISDLAGPTTLLDIAALSGAINPGLITAIEVIDQVVDIANSLSFPAGENMVLYFDDILPGGTFTIYDSAAAGDAALPDLTDPNLDLSGLANNLEWLPEELQAALGAVSNGVQNAAKKMLPGGEASSGFKLPIIDDPSQIFGMFLGTPAVLVEFDMAPLDVKADFSAFFSIFGPLGVSINAEFKALIDFSFGYDTQGAQDFAASDFRNPALLFNGFFVGDMDSTGKIDIAELQFDAGLWAAAELNLGIARGGVGGGLFAEIDFNLHDPNHDGRIRLSELATNFLNELEYGEPILSPLAIFDVTGSLTAKLFAFLKIDLGLFSIDEKFDITPPIELLNFNIPFTRVPTLATDAGGGVLQLNMGQFAAERIEGDKTDGNEEFTVTGNANDLAVTAFGFTQHYTSASGWKKILALGGEGNDVINLSGVTGNIGFEIEGNAGNDTIQGGTAATGDGNFLGGGGDDSITGGGGADVIFGETGNDYVAGGGGTDWLFGDGKPEDALQGTTIVVEPKLNDGNDSVLGDAGTDLLFGGGGNDSLEGGSEADVLIGDGGKVTVNGSKVATAVEDTDRDNKDGNDSLKGDAGDDSVYAGAGNDTVLGGTENDKIYGETGADSIQGEAGNDTVYAGEQNDNVDGGAGADSIFGEEGHDTVTGGTENDWISGGTGNDSLAGGAGNDTVFGNSDLDTLTGDAGADFLEGGHSNDTVTGGIGSDTLVGGYGSDILDGESGNDSYNISARGGSTIELTTAYDSGPLADTDILTVNGTADADTFLLRAMADAYFPKLNDLDKLISKILKSGKAEKLDLLKEGITNRYGFYGVPTDMLDDVETAFNANPIDNSTQALLDSTTAAAIAAVNVAIAANYVPETKTLVHKKIEQIFTDNAAADAAAKFALVSQAITDLYSPHPLPAGMLAAIEAAITADADSVDDAIAAFDSTFVNDPTLGQDTAFVALINDGGSKVERFNYRAMEGLVLNTLHGNDYVASDDVMASTTINLGLDNDRVQIGQVFTSQRDDNPLTANIAEDDMFGTVAITRGFLSAGVSRPTVVNGGDGNDDFTVFHNTAVVNLNGGDGDDLFTIRAFALAGSTDSERARTDMKGDGGADTIRYALNAPVGIDGGDGFDTVRVVGTEFSDDFVVTDSGVFGAGLNISYVNIEKLVADGAEGNDRFFVMSTGLDVITEIDGGLGSDSFFVGGAPGNAPIPVISDDFKGHSGVVLNNVESTDPAWQNVKADGVSANIADNDEAFLIVTPSGGGSSVTEDATSGGIGVEFDTYKIRLSRKPAAGKNVLIKLVDAGLPPEDQARKYKDLEFWNGSAWVTAQDHPGLLFTSTNDDWKNGLEVKFRAAHDDASEGQRFTFVNHITENSTDEDFAGVQTLSVKVLINDDDRANVVISSANNNNTVLENGFTDSVNVVLTRQPTHNVTVTLASTNNQISLSDTTLVFTTSNWNTPQPVTVTALNDAVVEGFHTDFITATVSSSDVDVHKTVALATVDADLLLPGPQAILPEKATSFVFLEHRPDLTQPVTIQLDLTTIPRLADGEITPELRYTITGNTLTFVRNGNAAAVSGTVKAAYKYVERGYNNILVKDTSVDIYDNEAAMVIVTQSDGSTDVLEGGYTDKYTVVLSKAPAAGKTVTINVDAIKTRTTLDGDAEFKEQVTVNGLSVTTLTFTDGNWNVPQEVTVEAIDDTFQDGSETQVFAPELNTVNKIRGPLIIEGAAGAGSLSLPDPLMLPGELNARESHGNVVAFTPGTGGGAIETMTVDTQDLIDHLADVDVDSLAKLVGKTIELTKGPGTDVILDPTRPRDLYDRFWLITQIIDIGGGKSQLRLQNPTMVDPGQPNVTAPTTDTEYAVTSLSVNFFVDERTSVDYTNVFDQDSVADDTGRLTSSDGNVLTFTPSGGTLETMTVETTDLQHLDLQNNDFNNLVDKIIEITIGPGKGRKWIVKAVNNTADSQVKSLTLEKLAGGSGNPTDRSEFRVDGFDRHGRILGLGMGPNVVIGAGVQPGGITYGDMEVLQVNLGNGNDTIDVDYTTNAEGHTTKRSGDFYTLTMLNLGAGNDIVNARIDAAQDGDIAIRGQAGNDTINATGSTLGITAFGEEGNDTITGGSGQDSVFGDFGRVDFVDAEGEIITRLGHSIPLNPVNPPVVSATAATITDPTANFTTEYGGLVGLMMQVIAPDGHVQFRRIIANTATTLTVDRPWDTMPITGQLEPDENSAYRISALPEDQGDGTYRGPRVVWSIDNGVGGNDVINGGDGKDLLVGGAANDAIDAGAGDDIVGGDNIRVDFTPVTGNDGPTKVVKISETGVGGNDSINAGADADVVIAGLGNDTVNGQAGNDVIVGDRGDMIYKADGVTIDSIETTDRANGGDDRIYGNDGDDVVIGGTGSDALDGGTERDLVFGDNVRLVNNVGSADAIKGRFRTVAGATIYNAAGQPNVSGPVSNIANKPAWADWTITLDQTPANFGNDYIAGGASDDQIFGQLGNDTVQGDGSIDITVSATQPSVEAATDGDDYIEGNAGNDVLLGNLGQDDLIGGSSNLFSLTTPALRQDGADIIFGGAGIDTARNNLGDTGNTAHSRDADFIIGDNGNIYRLVDAAGNYRTFTYDNYGPLKLIPRSVQHLDYTYGGNAATDIGGADLIHGESGDDSVYGTVSNDVLFGEGQDDDIFGGIGHDRIYGGSGEDGVIGDDGLIFTSRNGLTETLHGINTVSAQTEIFTSGKDTGAWVYITGRLNKSVQLLAYEQGGNDVIYGGLGDDFLHAGQGNDAVSGAEALAAFYSEAPVINTTPLVYDPATRKLAGYDANNPRAKIANFLLNFEASVGGVKVEDGKDRIFGDLGHDWLMGGTGNDRIFGGRGDDVMNADDNLDSPAGNDVPDAAQFADADFVYGGDGLDVLIGNTGKDRLFDWSGEFNSFFVPFSQFGAPTVNRLIMPGVPEFLLALGAESGADRTRVEPDGELGLYRQGDAVWNQNTGNPRDPQPGTSKAKIDTVGGREDDRNTALPL